MIVYFYIVFILSIKYQLFRSYLEYFQHYDILTIIMKRG